MNAIIFYYGSKGLTSIKVLEMCLIGLLLLVSRFSDSEVSLGLPTSRSDGILGGEFL